ECNSKGLKTAIIDEREFGGTCALRGCDPKKVLVGASELIDWSNRMKHVLDGSIKINWKELMRFKKSFTDPHPKKVEEGFLNAGIDPFHGKARFKDANTIKVNEDELEARYIVIATGASPAKLNIEGEEHLITSEQFLELNAIPDDIVFIGGGYISFEFAHIAARAGSKVTILHRGKVPLEKFDKELVEKLEEKSKSIGINIYTNSAVKGIKVVDGKYRVIANNTIDTKLVVHGAGRTPNIDLDLDNGNIAYARGIKVNEYLQSITNPNVYAAGDVIDNNPYPLTPIAGYHGKVVAHNIINGNKQRVDYKGVPSVVFTTPPLASVGLREDEINGKVTINKGDMSSWYSSRRINERYSMFKVLLDEEDHILGAHILAHHAEEIINIFALAIRLNLTIDDVKSIIFTYPTLTYDINYML
ncbi:MAG: NAD(P)/FAD-dependent oxidoreductase, partial [Candidatus Nitrosothermus koennekii]